MKLFPVLRRGVLLALALGLEMSALGLILDHPL